MQKMLCVIVCLMLLCSGASPAAAEEGYAFGAWLPYWDADASLWEAEALAGRMDAAVAFACLFDSEDRPLMLDDTRDLLSALQQMFDHTDTTVYLSIVNDIEVSKGKYENKSTDLLRRLFQSEEAMSAHLEALASLIDEYSLDGLELDYENIKGDTGLWAAYAAFIEKAWSMCERDGVRLRVVLPWNAPKYASLPAGPEYTVMCYNLYGYHSGAGPKADFDFLRETCELYRNVPGTVRMAFATGGFEWNGGKITSMTQEGAEEALFMTGIAPSRDAGSGALNAAHEESGVLRELWYADGATLAAWRDVCAQYGFTALDLFRLGGNNLDDWNAAGFAAQSE